MKEAPGDPLRDLKAAARWENGVSHTNWMCADLQRLVYSPDSEDRRRARVGEFSEVLDMHSEF